jgi:L-ascorbate metabolism protein UlaG (beta-lactamase superfamily)
MHSFEALQVADGKVGIHWFGQNSFALKDAGGTIIQIDPYFPHNRPAERFIHPVPPLNEAELPTDIVLLTHDHGDHTCLESLERIHTAFPHTRFVGPVESVNRMREGGIPESQLAAIAAGESMSLGAVQVHAFWSKPPEGAPADDIRPPDVAHLGYVIELGGLKVYVTGDMINTFAEYDELVKPVAAMEPDVGLLTMHPTEGEFPYFDGAVKLAMKLGLKAAAPAHYACFTKRTYDPYAWAALLPEDGPEPLIIPYNTAVVYPE